jgi:phosphoribosyl 1,2-cyclic phosphodiesterase
MQVQFWGTRGSLAKPGPHTARYGGNTLCHEVRSAGGTLVILDVGTGAHALGLKLMAAKPTGLRGHILISHTHWDHIQGLPFFAPLFAAGNEWDIYGPKGLDQSLRETLAGQMQYTYFPVTPDQFGAKIRYHDLLEGSFEVGDIRVSTHYLNHPALTLGYRLEADGATLAYCCDHEPFSRALGTGQGEISGQDQRHAEFVRDADLVIHDGQYTGAEYPNRIGWGHSTAEYVLKVAQHAGVAKVALTHHDPLRSDEAVDGLQEKAREIARAAGSSVEVLYARENDVIEVRPAHGKAAGRADRGFKAETALEPSLSERSVLLSVDDASMAATLSEAIRAEGIKAHFFSGIDEARKLIAKDPPSLVIVEHNPSRIDGMTLSREIRQAANGHADQLPVVVVAAQEEPGAPGVTDWMIRPFASAFARTKIRAWVLRTACNWMKAKPPADEAQRVASLHALKILDTVAEERFDRVTRLATALFDVPMAMISLVDTNRQWFKSCIGTDTRQTGRDEAFCSHVVTSREPMIIADAFRDPRFADNPLVLSDPHIRFYAGVPLILKDGSCIGTLCLVDIRPRTLQGNEMQRLNDLANITIQEIQGMTAAA